MLLRTILLPSALGPVPEDPLSQKLFCGLGIRLLHDLAENGLVLVDNENCTTGALFQVLDLWPVKFRKRAKELLTRLRAANRFVKISSGYELSSTCPSSPCQHCVGIAKSQSTRVILAGEDCCRCARGQISTTPTIDVADYSLSEFLRFRHSALAFVLSDGEWTQDDFEAAILVPLFADAKHVKIYDRHIGRAIWTKENDRQTLLTKTSIRLHYRLALEWIFSVFLRESGSKSGRVFEICSGLDVRRLAPQEISVAVTALRQFEADMQKTYGFPIKVTIKKETHLGQMPHGRYLITDQVGILIERGFDLLWTDDQMRVAGLNPARDKRRVRDAMIDYCPDPSKIEKNARQLPDL